MTEITTTEIDRRGRCTINQETRQALGIDGRKVLARLEIDVRATIKDPAGALETIEDAGPGDELELTYESPGERIVRIPVKIEARRGVGDDDVQVRPLAWDGPLPSWLDREDVVDGAVRVGEDGQLFVPDANDVDVYLPVDVQLVGAEPIEGEGSLQADAEQEPISA